MYLKSRIFLKSIFIIIICCLSSCATQYFSGQTTEDVPLYYSTYTSTSSMVTVPKGAKIIVKGNGNQYRKIKYNDYVGWAYAPKIDSIIPYNYTGTFRTTPNPNSYFAGSGSSTHSSGGSVNVKGYYRKDGTYVKPHTRSSPGTRTKSYATKTRKKSY